MAVFSSVSSSLLLTFFLLFGLSVAREILVGGKTDAWRVPASESDALNQWAERSRFQVGDFLGNYLLAFISQTFSFFSF